MRIQEIKPSHIRKLNKTAWKTPIEIKYWLQNNGYTELGWGFHSSIWGKENQNVVIKSSSINDRCYLKFAEVALQNRNNKHFPKMTKPKIFKTNYGTFFIVFIEKLYRVNPHPGDKRIIEVFLEVLNNWLTPIHSRDEIDLDIYSFFEQDLQRLRDRGDLNTLNPEEIKEKITRELLRASLIIKNNLDDCNFDFKLENIMTRKDGTIVIIDPVYGFLK